MKKFFKRLWEKTKEMFIKLKDWRNLVIFLIVFVILSCEVWVPYLIGFITGNAWWFGIGSACWLFWLAPGTPFLTICIVVTFAVRKVIDKIKSKRGKKDEDK